MTFFFAENGFMRPGIDVPRLATARKAASAVADMHSERWYEVAYEAYCAVSDSSSAATISADSDTEGTDEMPKKGARLPWRLTFQYATQERASSNAYSAQSEAERQADEMVRTAARNESSVSITISNRDSGESYSYPRTEGVPDMPAKKTAATKPEEIDVDGLTSQVHELADRIKTEKNPAELESLAASAESIIRRLPTAKRTALRKAVKDAKAAAAKSEPKPEPEPAEPSTEIVKNTDDPMTWDNVPQLIEAAAAQMREGSAAGRQLQSAGERVANILLTIRQNMIDPETGLPDLVWRMKATRNAAGKVYADALKGVSEDEVELREAHAALQIATRNKASDVLVAWLRGYDRDDEKSVSMLAEIFPGAVELLEADPELSAEGAIRQLYAAKSVELPIRGRTEAMRITRRMETIEKTTKQIEAHQDAGNAAKVEELQAKISDLKADLPPDALAKLGETAAEKSDAERTKETISKARKLFETAGKRQAKLTAAQKRKTKAELYTLIREMVDTFGLDYSALAPAEETEAENG
ncbi:hypothetical protein F0344_04790 [Streptomyces finlayi]|uniref:Uncharacterized protein n=1 Tax=Streptomyces finlayi TaxID=67296 RepID=A0A7G7BF94_9ACTN|nr:hypothetical protein [Streptomyces finlayi]QNE74009.1 hypothetical protein F0344_04790 [Streptomyces finlayi]